MELAYLVRVMDTHRGVQFAGHLLSSRFDIIYLFYSHIRLFLVAIRLSRITGWYFWEIAKNYKKKLVLTSSWVETGNSPKGVLRA